MEVSRAYPRQLRSAYANLRVPVARLVGSFDIRTRRNTLLRNDLVISITAPNLEREREMEVASRPVEISIDDQLYDLSIKIIPTLLPAGEKRLELRPTREKSKIFRKIGNFIGKSETGRSINFSLILFPSQIIITFRTRNYRSKNRAFSQFS